MDLQISVFLLFILFTAGHSLRCYECMGETGSCADQTIQSCPSGSSMCRSSTTVTKFGDISYMIKDKYCAAPCRSGSVNIGKMRMLSSCCNTDLCNLQDAPDSRTVAPNGKTCYSYDDQNCTTIMRCSGTQDRCITVTRTSKTQDDFGVVKGCASKSICDATAGVSRVEVISCCEGNLCNGAPSDIQSSTCNGAPSVSQSFLFLCCSLLSYFLLH